MIPTLWLDVKVELILIGVLWGVDCPDSPLLSDGRLWRGSGPLQVCPAHRVFPLPSLWAVHQGTEDQAGLNIDQVQGGGVRPSLLSSENIEPGLQAKVWR